MNTRESAFVLGQRYNLATLALVVALLSFLNLAGLEKAILAIVIGVKALRPAPPPALEQRREGGVGAGGYYAERPHHVSEFGQRIPPNRGESRVKWRCRERAGVSPDRPKFFIP